MSETRLQYSHIAVPGQWIEALRTDDHLRNSEVTWKLQGSDAQ